MKVYIRRGVHNMYNALFAHPPAGVEYVIPEPIYRRNPRLDRVKNVVWANYTKFFPPSIKLNVPADTDAILSTGGITVKNKMPWIVDFESTSAFSGHHHKALQSPRYRRAILKRLMSPYCKKIVADSEAARRYAKELFPEVASKMEVVYMPVEPRPAPQKKYGDRLNILFVGKRFYMKGGHIILKAYDLLKNKMDLSVTLVSNVPPEYASRYKNDSNVRIVSNIPDSERDALYDQSHVFVFPTHFDTYGIVLFEAMSRGLPVITVRQYAAPELVQDGETGFLVDTTAPTQDTFAARREAPSDATMMYIMQNLPNVDQLAADMADRIMRFADTALLRRMARNAHADVTSGEHSLDAANAVVKNVYEEAVRK